MAGEFDMSGLSVFHFDANRPSFEDHGKANGVTHWSEETLMSCLGYKDAKSFANAVNRAKKACLTLNIDIDNDFAKFPDGTRCYTRFACYMIAMNGDVKKPEVAEAQYYFAAIAATFKDRLEAAEGIERILIRDEITEGHKSLSSTAAQHGVINYAFFVNAGYRGMYNMSLKNLEKRKGIKKGEKLIDRMGRAEMAANLFRITQTESKIKNEDIHGQANLEKAANIVGRRVRKMMIENSGVAPENEPLAEDVNSVRKKIKNSGRNLKKLDKPVRRKK